MLRVPVHVVGLREQGEHEPLANIPWFPLLLPLIYCVRLECPGAQSSSSPLLMCFYNYQVCYWYFLDILLGC